MGDYLALKFEGTNSLAFRWLKCLQGTSFILWDFSLLELIFVDQFFFAIFIITSVLSLQILKLETNFYKDMYQDNRGEFAC